jgi:hypothetical protein
VKKCSAPANKAPEEMATHLLSGTFSLQVPLPPPECYPRKKTIIHHLYVIITASAESGDDIGYGDNRIKYQEYRALGDF